MWLLLRVCSLSLLVASAGALAQSGPDPASPGLPNVQLPNATPALSGTTSEAEIRSKSEQWHAECLRDWDAQTHMTKKQWADTCQRVVGKRVQWLRDRVKQ
jgi:hypothetical protein